MADKNVTTKLVMQGDSSGLVTALKNAHSHSLTASEGFARMARGASALIAPLAALAGVASLGALVKGSIDAADNMSKMSQKVGVAIDQLSGMAYAANLADVSTEQLGKGMGKLAKLMYEAAGDKDGGPAKTFQTLGISVTDAAGKLRGTDEVMMDVAERMSGMKDGAGKTALAMELFGKAGADLIPLLNAGKQGIREAADEAKRFGIVLTEEAGKQAEEFNDNLTRLKARASGVAQVIGGELLKEINALVDKFAKGGDIANSPLMDGLRSVKAEFLRLAMLADKAGGSLTAVGMLLYGPGSMAGYKPSVERFNKMAEYNIMFEERYKESEKAMQTMANLEVGLDADGNRFKAKGSTGTGGSDAPPKLKTGAGTAVKDNFSTDAPGFMNWRREAEAAKAESEWIEKFLKEQEAALGSYSEDGPGFMGWKRDAEGQKEESAWIEKFLKEQEAAKRNSDELLKIETDFQKSMNAVKLDAAQSGLGLMRAMAGENKTVLIGIMIAEKAIAIARIIANTEVAASAALAIPIVGVAQAASIRAMGYVSIGMVAASGIMEGAQIAGKKAAGGPVSGGSTYLIGERGPELFTPGASGMISPNSSLSNGQGITINQTFNANNADETTLARMKTMVKQGGEQVKAEVMNSMNRGGSFALASGRR